ncbi:hypothetical protein H9L09_03480 [Nocardioides mesophilus]|uniref:Uncharacterized protein n=1 Tax=Nocardioides mesophilus TaxID=433659 RepID=A0A7G9RGT5_9ACTN|nr:hypothetical protein H9L09_03480 [Nocardioides mesophilus]
MPPFLARLLDDAAIFPPGNAPLPDAVRAHEVHRVAAYAAMVGPLVVDDPRLPDLIGLAPAGPTPLEVAVVVTGGAGALGPAVHWAERSEALRLAGVEIALRGTDTSELPHNARRIVTAVDQLLADGALDDDTTISIEMPRLHGAAPGHSWLSALDEIAASDHRLKFRTGGADADAFPGPAELATCIGAALDRELRFKCTAGLHHALRHRDPDTGFDQHGFLNVLLATRLNLDGASADDVVAVLDRTDPDDVRRLVEEHAEGLAGARRWFTSIGTCSVTEPLADLAALGLLPDLPATPSPTPEEHA